MRVLFNAYAAVTPPLTGVGHYARRLLRGLSECSDVDLVCYSEDRVLDLPDFATPLDAAPPRRSLPQRAVRALAHRMPYARQVRLLLAGGGVQKHYRDAIHHEPNHILQPFDGRNVVTIHDLSVLHYPQFHPRQRVAYFDRHLRETVARADRIIVDSAFIGRDLQTTLGVAADRIRVVPLGVGEDFQPMPAETTAPALASYGLTPGGYLLAVGAREPRKNLERLLEAYLMLPESARARAPLALVGPAGWRIAKLEARIDALERAGQLKRLGYVPDADRALLYAGALGLAYPSLYEGFGLPPLEAAACGAPVLTSRNSPMEEILGETAILADPLDVDDIHDGLTRLLDDHDIRAHALRSASNWTGQFSWAACVDRTAAVYRELA